MNFANIYTLVGLVVGGILGPLTANVVHSKFFKSKEEDRIIVTYGNDYELFASKEMLDYMYPVAMFREINLPLFSQLCSYIDAYYRLRADKDKEINGTYIATARGLLLKAQVLLFDFVKEVREQEEYTPEQIVEFEQFANAVEEVLNDELIDIRHISLSAVF